MKLSNLLLLPLIIASSVSSSQTYCGSEFDLPQIQKQDTTRYNKFLKLERHVAKYKILKSSNTSDANRLINPNSTITIPVVVHVLHRGEPVGTGNNISDAQVQSQIDVLNEDFRRLNADRFNTPAAFLGVAADPNFEFRLACTDPNGASTNGINRVSTTVDEFAIRRFGNGRIDDVQTGIKYSSRGGVDAWATNRYLNIWVCNIAPEPPRQLLGYARFPEDYNASPNIDGVVVLNRAFGRTGFLLFGFDEGRTATHEVGHWLGLRHIWGDDERSSNNCAGSDFCDDTPNQAVANADCPPFPHPSCGNGPNGDMFMNYMDLTLDACQNIFTQDQTDIMRSTFTAGGARESFINNYFNIAPIGDAPICDSRVISVVNISCLPVVWSVVYGPATILGSGNSVTLQRNGTQQGPAMIRATAGGYIDEVTVNIGRAAGVDFYVESSTSGGCHGTFTMFGLQAYSLSQNNYTVDYEWSYLQESTTVPTVVTPLPCSGSTCTASFSEEGTYQLRLLATDGCGGQTGAIKYVTISNNCGGGGGWIPRMSLSPNPAKNDLYVTIENEALSIKQNKPRADLLQINLYNSFSSQVIRTWKFQNNQKQYRLNIAGIKKGNYVVQVVIGNRKVSKQVHID